MSLLAFTVHIQPGKPVYEQIVFAAKRAVARGVLRPGDRFPSVRELSRELKINPNTVQRAVAGLTIQGVIEVYPGRGCYVSQPQQLSVEVRRAAMEPMLEALLVEAVRLGFTREELLCETDARWRELIGEDRKESTGE